jgi:hypothetical protein
VKCVHCEQFVQDAVFVYPLSRAVAHVGCVSVVSSADMDAFLLAQQQRSTRRVYTAAPRRAREG